MIKHLRICSDLHLEGFLGRDAATLAIDFVPHDDRDAASLLILAGDISSAPDQLVAFIRALQPRFEKVLFIPGNHEYYRHNYVAWNRTMAERFEEHCPGLLYALSSVGYYEIDGTRFIYGTMWGDGGPTLADQGQVGFYLNDFRLITMPGHDDPSYRPMQRHFTVADMVSIFKTQKAEIKRFLSMPFEGKTVVVTHHLPSRRLVSARFWPGDGSDGANGGFVGDCDDILAYDDAPDMWIFGHTHDSLDTELWKTRMICNPAGYRGEWMSKFNTFMVPNSTGGREVQPKFVELT